MIFSSLFTRLSLFFLLTLTTLGLTVLWISHSNSRGYFLEFTQRLNSPIAMYMAENAELVQHRQPDLAALAKLLEHVVVINPSVEVYLLDLQGNIIKPEVQGVSVVDSAIGSAATVDLQPIRKFLSADAIYPIFGTNPQEPARSSIFSVAPLYSPPSIGAESEQVGYVYVVLAGERHQSLLDSLENSYSTKNLLLTLAGTLLLTLMAGITVFSLLTRRLRMLTHKARQWHGSMQIRSQSGDHQDTSATKPTPLLFDLKEHSKSRDEIDVLAATYDSMATQLLYQFQNLQMGDKSRRELFENISHDLRTPLTTMQSYLETLVLKFDVLNATDRKRYLTTAHNQTLRMQRLVSQLFELSKLSSGSVELAVERFSLLELAFDCIQQFALEAQSSNIVLSVVPQCDDSRQFEVLADIALIQRVFENLLANALRFTPNGGSVSVNVTRGVSQSVHVCVCDSGSGLSEEQMARAFTRYSPGEHNRGGAGLGLSIVKSIMDLHGTEIRIISAENKGAEIRFSLPAAL